MDEKRIYRSITRKSDIFIILLFPILLVSLNSNWIFSPVTDFLPDPWFYLGYFRYFYEYAPSFPSNIHYFVERITWNLTGYYFYKILPPLQANIILHLSVCYLALFSLYGTLSILYNDRTALLTTLIMGGYPWFLRAVGWDYVDGIGISLMLFLLFILTINKYPHLWRYQMIFGGIIHASLLITNLFWIGFAPAWMIYFLYINGPSSKEKIWRMLGKSIYFTLGNIALVFVIAIYYYKITGNINFLQNSFTNSVVLSHNTNVINFITTYYGNMPPLWHILPVSIAVASLWQIKGKSATHNHHKILMPACIFFIFSYGWLIFWHYYSLPYLIVFLYSSFAIPAIFILLGGLLSNLMETLSKNQFNTVIGTVILLLAAPFLLVTIFPILVDLQGNLVLLALSSIILVASLVVHKFEKVVWLMLTSISSISFLVGLNSSVHLTDPLKGHNDYMAIIKSSNFIDIYYPSHSYSDFRLWYRRDINYDVFFSLSALYLYPWGSAINDPVSGKAPTHILSISKRDKFNSGDDILILSSNSKFSDVMAEANLALSSENLTLVLDHAQEIREGSVQFTLYFTHAETKITN